MSTVEHPAGIIGRRVRLRTAPVPAAPVVTATAAREPSTTVTERRALRQPGLEEIFLVQWCPAWTARRPDALRRRQDPLLLAACPHVPHPQSTSPGARIAAFDFRGLYPGVRFGTASDRYGGWLGQIYSEDRWASLIKTRRKRLGRETFDERVLPVESVAEYFEHFEVLEIDFTFYRPLLEGDGTPSSNLFVLERYAEHAPENGRFLLKAPQLYTARVLRRGRGGRPAYDANPTYLDADGYVARFLAPATDLLGPRLAGVLFEQEYARVGDSPPPEAFVGELDTFFRAVDEGAAGAAAQTHLEIRSPHLLAPPYFDWLASRGLGFCFSHWTWLPSIKEQWQLAGGQFTAAGGNAVLRLLTPRKMRYEEAYARAHPFDRPVPELADTREACAMVDETVALVVRAVEASSTIDVIVNNRAWGNAPALAQTIARRFGEIAPA